MEKVLLSTEILSHSEALQKTLIDMETGFRGYMIVENESFLIPYKKGHETGLKIFPVLTPLVKDSAEAQMLRGIRRIGRDWINNFAQPVIEAKRKSIQDPSKKPAFDSIFNAQVKTGLGNQKMLLVRQKFEEFDRHQIENKNAQIAAFNQSLDYTRLVSIILTAMAILLGILIAFLLGQTVRRRITAMINLADHIAQGDFEARIADHENDEMSRLSRSLNVMGAKLNAYFTNLTKMNKELDQFAYVVSHDLKAPLRAINNLAEWISEDIKDQDPEIHKNLQLMRGRVHRMENLINGILAYSKVGRKDVPTETFPVTKLLTDIVDSLAPPKNFTIVLPDNAPVLTTEKIFMEQVFTNLISNGIKYNDKPEGRIEILTGEENEFYRFSVTDNGPGIPLQFQDRIFGVFQTMEARDTRESTGVGLAIVKKIIDEKGGRIWIESKEQEFTSFIFTWPKNNAVKH
ncbi:ATP-binding protein [Adhaeribacter soli]|nr:ATP-binding protein [Adhaeribacter soli]